MAEVHRPVARAGLALLIAGCGAPISNQVFLEEAVFVGVLPSEARFAPAIAVERDIPHGAHEIPASAKEAAADWRGLVQLAISSGEALRGAEPDERTEILRRWGSVNAASDYLGGPLAVPDDARWWVQGEIVQLDGGPFEWTIALAVDEDGPYTEVAWGDDDGLGIGTLSMDLDAVVAVLQLDPAGPPGTLAAQYAGEDTTTDPPSPRSVSCTWTPVGVPVSFSVIGDNVFGYTGTIPGVTEDGLAWPGALSVFHTLDGGWAEGLVLVGDDSEVAFTACWDGAGALQLLKGDPGVAAQGDSSRCTVENPF